MRVQINKYHIIYMLVMFLFLTGCKVRRPKDVIPEGKMEELLYDYHIAKALGDNIPYNENYKKALYIEYVFKKHGTTEAVFDSSMVWYTRNAAVLSKIYERVNKKLKAEQAELDKLIAIRDNKPEISSPGDSIDVWLLDRILHLSNAPLNNKLAFVIPSDSNFKSRDTLQWNIHYYFPGTASDSIEAALMSLTIQYTNDSIISSAKKVFKSGNQSIRLQSDTLGDIKEIRGFIYFAGNQDSIKHLFADQISLMRYHSNDSLFVAKSDTINKAKEETLKVEPAKEEAQTEQPTTQQERVNPDELRRNRGERPRAVQKGANTVIQENQEVTN